MGLAEGYDDDNDIDTSSLHAFFEPGDEVTSKILGGKWEVRYTYEDSISLRSMSDGRVSANVPAELLVLKRRVAKADA